MVYMSEEEVRAICRRTGQKMPDLGRNASRDPEGREQPKRSKYGNRKTEVDKVTFASLHEAERAKEFDLQVRGGLYRAVLSQVPFLLPGGVVYKADFVTLNNDGTYTVFDAKSEATRKDKAYRIKYRLMKNCLNIEIREI